MTAPPDGGALGAEAYPATAPPGGDPRGGGARAAIAPPDAGAGAGALAGAESAEGGGDTVGGDTAGARRAAADQIRGRRCLVTGAAGFLGSALCRALVAAGAEVHGAVRPRGSRGRLADPPPAVTLHEADLRDAEAVSALFRRMRPCFVFHAAAHPGHAYAGQLAEAIANDVLAVAHLLDAAAETAGLERLVHLGGALEYGPAAAPLREDAPLAPASPRGATKAAASLLVLERSRAGAVPGVVVRPFHVYGPGESPDRLVPAAIRAALAGTALPLADTPSERDPVFVDDVAAACLAAAVAPGAVGEAINAGSGRGVTNRELVAAVAAAVGGPIAIEPGAFPPRATDAGRRIADIGKARRLLGWEPAHDLAAGLAATVAWWRAELAGVASGRNG